MRHAKPALLASVFAVCALLACSPHDDGPAAETVAQIQSLEAALATLERATIASQTPHAEAGPGVYIVNIKDGDTVASPLRVVFGLHGMGVAPALIAKDNTGHHHLLVDTELSDEEKEFAIPNDAQHIHFGGGQTETVLELSPGQHTLKLVLADLNHTPFVPSIESETITVTVK